MPTTLSPTECPIEHPCADPSLYAGDEALLAYILQDLRALMRRVRKGEVHARPSQKIEWEVHGLKRRMVLCDPSSLLTEDTQQVVGFFGTRRIDADVEGLEEIELELLDEFRSYPGIRSYSSIELVDHHWANLVIHAHPDDRVAWRGSVAHRRAAESIAPRVYSHVRIHNGSLPGGVIGSEQIDLAVTKYWDYTTSRPWHAIRELRQSAPC